MGMLSENDLLDDEILEELQPFITEWTVEAGDSITLPLNNYAHNKYNFTVDYGDGTKKEVTSADDEDSIHTYENSGTYQITIKGNCPSFNFSKKSASKDKIIKIIQWGNTFKQDGGINLGFSVCFKDCINLLDPIPEPSKNTFRYIVGLEFIFSGCSNITKIPEKIFYNAPLISSYRAAFSGCVNLTDVPDKLFDNCDNATNFDSIFSGCTSLKEVQGGMFRKCKNAVNMNGIFDGCNSLKSIPSELFGNCKNIKSVRNAFNYCKNIEEIPEGLFDSCTEIEDFYRVFGGCNNLKILPENIFDNCNNPTNFIWSFSGCSKITGNAPKLWEKYTDANGQGCFSSCNNLSNYNQIPKAWGGGGE